MLSSFTVSGCVNNILLSLAISAATRTWCLSAVITCLSTGQKIM